MPSSRPPATPSAPPRNVRFGPYTLVDRIAVGGMAEVFRATEPRAVGEARTVAIKRMLPHVAAHPDARTMFEEEARLGSSIAHPNVVEVLGRGDEGGQPYLVLEYVPGVDLWRLVRWLGQQERSLPVPLVVLLVGDLLAGLHAVHEACDAEGRPLGIVHRDVSPPNVLLSHHGDVKLGDLGIARHRLQESFGAGTLPGRAKGKLGYLSPEQVEGTEPDRRSDVFSAAVIAAELLMGRPLFAGESELAVLLAIRDANTGPFREAARSLPAPVAETISAGLARDRSDRLPDARTFRERLLEHGGGSDEGAWRQELGSQVTAAMGSRSDAPDTTPLREVPWGTQRRAAGSAPPAPAPNERPTGELPPLEYQVRTPDGTLRGPWTFARTVEAISTGSIGSADRVSVAGGAFRPLDELPELERHLSAARAGPATTDGTGPREADERIPLREGGIVTVLGRSVLRSETGLWLCERGNVRKEVYVQRGVPAFVTSNLAGELLGEYLVTHGVIARSELDMALAVMPRFEGRLGDTLVALGLVEPLELFRRIGDQVREKLLDLFLWREGTAELHRGVAPPTSGFPLGLEPWRILEEGVKRRLAHGLEADAWRETRGRLRRCPHLPSEVRMDRLPGPYARVLRQLADPTEVGQIASDPSHPTDEQTAAIVLLHLGALEWHD